MNPERRAHATLMKREQAALMERVMVRVRRLWFGSQEVSLHHATLLVESGGELLLCVDTDSASADELVTRAAESGAYMAVTGFSRPGDLGARLRKVGFTVVQRHGTYILDEGAYDAALPQNVSDLQSSGVFSFLHRRRQAVVTVRSVGEEELPAWNGVCWRAFGRRGSEADSLLEKQHAFLAMGDTADWYLAYLGERPVGTAICYQECEAAQVLAVGTLPECRRRGVATALLQRLIHDWRQRNHGFLFLDTAPEGAAAQLYHRLGFRYAYLREIYAPRFVR